MHDEAILITGATGSLGRAMVEHFLGRGRAVVATSRSIDNLSGLAQELGRPDKLALLPCDLTLPDASAECAVQASRLGWRVSGLVNNARSLASLALDAAGQVSREVFLAEFHLDVVVPYELTMALAASADHQLKSVVNIGSQYGCVAPNPALYGGTLQNSPIQYGVSKAALNHLTKELGARLAPRIRVNCVAFGGVLGRAAPEFVTRYSSMLPAGRMFDAAEINGPVDFLLNDASSSVTGHTLVADGGWSIW